MQVNVRIGAGSVVLAVALGVAWWQLDRFERAWARFTSGDRTVVTASTPGEIIVMRTPGGLLEVARIKAYERFTRSDNRTLFNGLVDLGTTVSDIEVAALYRYQIEMAKEWRLDCTDTECVVHAGALQPALPPGIYTDEVKKRTRNGWARFNKEDNLAQLERSLSQQLGQRATTQRNLDEARKAGRKTVEEFVRTWMLKDPVVRLKGPRRIVVLFPGETRRAKPGDL